MFRIFYTLFKLYIILYVVKQYSKVLLVFVLLITVRISVYTSVTKVSVAL